jgi:ABC-type transport system involved in multi-copper enzyme maturation permease subunit
MSAQIFRSMSYLQLGLVALLAPIFTAGAITQEKDSQTYDILLSTPLTTGRSSSGSLLSRLFFVIALLISGIPIFFDHPDLRRRFDRQHRQILRHRRRHRLRHRRPGDGDRRFQVGTRPHDLQLLPVRGDLPRRRVPPRPARLFQGAGAGCRDEPDRAGTTSWFTGLHPFLALETIFKNRDYMPPAYLELPEHLRRWPMGWYLSNPANFYTSFMFFLSFVLVTPSIVVLRRLAQSTVSLKTWVLQKLNIVSGDRTRKPRYVWSNPIAWREAKTKASAARASLLRYGFMAAGVVGAWLWCTCTRGRGARPSTSPPAATTRDQDDDRLRRQFRLALPGAAGHDRYIETPNANALDLGAARLSAEDIRGRSSVRDDALPRPPAGGGVADAARPCRARSRGEARAHYLLGRRGHRVRRHPCSSSPTPPPSTVTREKEDGSLDLLLTTPITSRYYIWGKLRGLVSFVLPLVAVPVVSILFFVSLRLAPAAAHRERPRLPVIVFPEAG